MDGQTVTESLNSIDIDAELKKGSTSVDVSANANTFEKINLSDLYSDGDYKLYANWYSGSEDITLKAYVKRMGGDIKLQLQKKLNIKIQALLMTFLKF